MYSMHSAFQNYGLYYFQILGTTTVSQSLLFLYHKNSIYPHFVCAGFLSSSKEANSQIFQQIKHRQQQSCLPWNL